MPVCASEVGPIWAGLRAGRCLKREAGGSECLGGARRSAVLRSRLGALSLRSNEAVIRSRDEVQWEDGFEERYEVAMPRECLGKGSFGEVFLAMDKRTGRKVAVKDLPMTRGKMGKEKTRRKVDREVAVMRALAGCAGVIETLGCFRTHEGRYWIVMECCEGRDLKQHLKDIGPFSELQVVFVAHEILKVIHACHNRNIVHGDVKTANFVLKCQKCNPLKRAHLPHLKSGWLKAIDFGCSQFTDEYTRLRPRVGTPVFMAPEVYERNYSFESDLWSLGILLYQLAAFRFPFWDLDESISVRSIDDVMETIAARNPDFSYGPWLKMSSEGLDFIQSLLDKNYKSRLSVEQAINHPWITMNIQNDSPGDDVMNNIVPTRAVLNDGETVGSNATSQYRNA